MKHWQIALSPWVWLARSAAGGWSVAVLLLLSTTSSTTLHAASRAGELQASSLAAQAQYSVGVGSDGETTIFVSGAGVTVTLLDIQAAMQGISPTTDLLVREDATARIWLANASLMIGTGVTLVLGADTVTWLKLRSERSAASRTRAADSTQYDYRSFVSLKAYDGMIMIDGVKVTSWDPTVSTYDTDIGNGRSYVLAKYNARLDIRNAEMSYLGSADVESYGVAWRDVNAPTTPDILQTRVTGDVLNSTFSYNYYGIYTFQAQNMVFRGDTFHHNIGYGFDPHDYSHHFTVEDNESFANGNHGFIISRGCNNFTFRRNVSHDNHYTIGTEDRRAHGFMLDPGAPTSSKPQVASSNNLLVQNRAYGNDGYGLRILGSTGNTIQGNDFSGNLQGITVELGSTDNLLKDNTITSSSLYGIYVVGGSDRTTISGNTITKSGNHGIYIKTGKNTVTNNTIMANGTLVAGVPIGSGIATLRESTRAAAAADLTLPNQRISIATSAPDLASDPARASDIASNLIMTNTISRNLNQGIDLKNATGTHVVGNIVQANGMNGISLAAGTQTTLVQQNVFSGNQGYGIRADGTDVDANTWTENQVFANSAGGIATTDGANGDVAAPKLTREGNTITGTTLPGATVELFSDTAAQARTFDLRLTADSTGAFQASRLWRGANVTATTTDAKGNSSALAVSQSRVGAPDAQIFLPLLTGTPEPQTEKRGIIRPHTYFSTWD